MGSVRLQARFVTLRSVVVLACALLSVCAVIVVVGRLQSEATAGHEAELELMALRLDLMQMRDIPWAANPEEGADPEDVRSELQGVQDRIESSLLRLRSDPGLPEYERILAPFNRTMTALWEIFEASANGKPDEAGEASGIAAEEMYAAEAELKHAAESYHADGDNVLAQARAGTVAVILLLFAAYAWFYVRAVRRRRTAETLAEEKRLLLAASRVEALTDALTGLGNRRALIADLAASSERPDQQVLLALCDLDGFKHYNDNFGHPAGDALLARLGERLGTTMAGIGTAYRVGGDEFCILSTVGNDGSAAITRLAASALSDAGEGFEIGCSYGTTLLPTETTDPDQALLLADQRMYEHKRSRRSSPSRQSADVLLQLLAERSSELGKHTCDVATLADRTAERLGLAADERARIRLAAELHDVGKAAIPDAILNKPGKLDDDEWDFIQRHSVIGERIVRAAPSLAHAADLVRWHHERHDGTGYPDRLKAHEIPAGARIIAVADAFDAMTTGRPYRDGITPELAIAELLRCAGTQFDLDVVAAFIAAISESSNDLPSLGEPQHASLS